LAELLAWCLARRQGCPTDKSNNPSPHFRGEREGPWRDISREPAGLTRGAREGEVGTATSDLASPPHPALSPRPTGGEE
jgi:hypothetical protein